MNAPSPAAAGLAEAAPTGTSRQVRRRNVGLPSGRAAVGGLLVAVAALATWWLAAGASRATPPEVIVAARALGPGHRIEASDLRLVTADLAGPLRQRAMQRGDAPVGRVLATRLAAGDLLQRSALRPAGRRDPVLASIAVDPDWAVAGTLEPGDHVDLIATFGEGASAATVQILRDAVVSEVASTGGAGIGQSSGQVITLAFDRSADLIATVNAARAGALSIARTPPGHPSPSTSPYRTADHLPSDASTDVAGPTS